MGIETIFANTSILGFITNPLLTFKFILLVFADGKLFNTYIYGYVVL